MASIKARERVRIEKQAITATNAKSPLLSLPPELRVRIFEYVFGHERQHVKTTRTPKNWRVSLARCEVDGLDTTRKYRMDTQEEHDARPSTNSNYLSILNDEEDPRRHTSCYYGCLDPQKWKKTTKKSSRSLLPMCLLTACKQIHQDAAAIMWLNHTFEVEFFGDDLESLVSRMSVAQRKAVRTFAFNFQIGGHDDILSPRPSTSFEDLLISRAAMRASYVALTGLRRVELFVDEWPGVVAAAKECLRTRFDTSLQKKELDMSVHYVRLLERQDLEHVDVRVEEGALMKPGHIWPFKVSAQQRSEWEEQLQELIKGRVLELGGEDSMTSG